jgi:hypothetical protein
VTDYPIIWETDTFQPLSIGTELNSLAAGSTRFITSPIDNSGGLWDWLGLEVTIGSIATAAGAGCGLYLINSIDDGLTYGDPVPSGSIAGSNNVGVSVGTGAKRMIQVWAIPFGIMRLLLVNNLNVATASSGNSVDYRFGRRIIRG